VHRLSLRECRTCFSFQDQSRIAIVEDIIVLECEYWLSYLSGHRVVHALEFGSYGAILKNVYKRAKPMPSSGKSFFFPLIDRVLKRAVAAVADLIRSEVCRQRHEPSSIS
jgi:hypothetical protein